MISSIIFLKCAIIASILSIDIIIHEIMLGEFVSEHQKIVNKNNGGL